MVFCCVPKCGTDSWQCDPSITFHDFPSSPDLAAKWIRQINAAVKTNPMWFPRGKPVICSKHFLSTDFKDDSDTLKPRVLPTVFGYKYIGQNQGVEEVKSVKRDKSGPLIVKIKTEDGENSDLIISEVYSQAYQLEKIINEPESSASTTPGTINISNTVPSHKSYQNNTKMGVKHQYNNSPKIKNFPVHKKIDLQSKGIIKTKTVIKGNTQKRDNNDNNLIEIGPNTFLKINPDVIKVNKKLTPSGNTVLQFLMDQKLANTIGSDLLPKIVQGAVSTVGAATSNLMKTKSNLNLSKDANENTSATKDSESSKEDTVVQHVVGHLVDTHVCKESCAKLQDMDNVLMETDDSDEESGHNSMLIDNDDVFQDKSNIDGSTSFNQHQTKDPEKTSSNASSNIDSNIISLDVSQQNSGLVASNEKADSTCIEKAPVLLTTNMSLAHCFMEKTKYLNHLRQKARQIASLKQKVSNLNKKIEELEDKCIVQERQLSFSFLKRLRTIRKNASKGDPPATYILEQIRAYTGQKQMRWSDSTLQQCAVWCRKAPYAYEYFKKADFFKLPCLGTVKRFIRKHPEMSFTSKSFSKAEGEGDDDSSSDFDFDEEDSMDEQDKDIMGDKSEPVPCETVLSEETNSSSHNQQSYQNNTTIKHINRVFSTANSSLQDSTSHSKTRTDSGPTVEAEKASTLSEVNSYPVTVDGTNLEVQELILPSGEVVQCYSSSICNNGESGNQYYIIPNASDQNSSIDHEYSVVQSADTVPVILQNLDNSQLHQEQLIFITNSSDQVECTETEIITAR